MERVAFDMRFSGGRKLRFSSEIVGLTIGGKEYFAGVDGVLIDINSCL